MQAATALRCTSRSDKEPYGLLRASVARAHHCRGLGSMATSGSTDMMDGKLRWLQKNTLELEFRDKAKRGSMRVLTAVTTHWSVGTGTVEEAAIDRRDNDVRSDDELDGERTGPPGLIQWSGTKETTTRMLRDKFVRRGEHGGRDGVDGHGVRELGRAGASRESEARREEEGGRGRAS